MRILCLCKRRPQGRDLFNQPYGRFYHLPFLLAKCGHEVHILLLGYKNEPSEYRQEGSLHWYTVSCFPLGPWPYLTKAAQLTKEVQPDWVIGFSDTYYGILAERLARRFGCKSLIDAYDNYESYVFWCKPLHYLWCKALSKTNLITAAGPQLAELMRQKRLDKPTMVLPMAVDPIGFKPLDKMKCRQALGLPSDKKLVGYCGSIHPNRGINLLFDAYKNLLRENKDIELVLTGRKGRGVSIPDSARWLGYLPDQQIPGLLNSMDVLTVINKSSAFGNYSYPVKLYEAMCCQVPVVVVATSSTKWILDGFPDLLATANDSVDLTKKIETAMQHKKIDYGHQQGWENEAGILEKALKKISQTN